MKCVQENVKPSRGRELVVEKLDGLWDWQNYLEPLELTMGGLAILQDRQDVNFAFRIVTRKDLKCYSGYEKWVEMPDEEQARGNGWAAN